MNVLPNQPETAFWHVGNVFVKQIVLEEKGHATVGHSHKWDHLTLCAKGRVLFCVQGGERVEVNEGQSLNIVAGKHHLIQALVDNCVLYCIHDTRGMDLDELEKTATPYDYALDIT